MKLQCWKCGIAIKEMRSPYSRYEECSACKADHHVCLMCREYDPTVSDGCREDRADFVLEKDKANFCDYFKPRAGAYQEKNDGQEKEARARLAELFGEEPKNPESDQETETESEADRALMELKRLFGDE